MRNGFLLLACGLIIALGVVAVPFPDGAIAIGLVLALSVFPILIFRRLTPEKEFITNLFLVALVLRMGFGVLIHIFDLRTFFGGDYASYDSHGAALVDGWLGHPDLSNQYGYQVDPASGPGWGMNYLTAFIYLLVGRNIFAAQSFCAVIGAATAPLVFFCSQKIFNNMRVAKVTAVAIAVFPSFVIWSGQLLKDGLIIFLLVLVMTLVLQLQEQFGYGALIVLVLSLFGILSLRFYIFYMVVIAVIGSFVIGVTRSTRHLLRNTAILVFVGVALTYLGVGQRASSELNKYANLESIQRSRSDLARANTGYAEDIDVSTTEGAITLMPIGFAYLMLAPFPWQMSNLRQMITMPEVLLWWAMVPFLVTGLIYTIKHRLRKAFPMLIFSLLLTFAYSIFQGNVGTAYRQRTQIQVFLFVLIGVGWTVKQEARENKKIIQAAARMRLDDRLRVRYK